MSLKIPFAWETQPGINKVQQEQAAGPGPVTSPDHHQEKISLPPPPCQVEKRQRAYNNINVHGIQVPLSTIPLKRANSKNGRQFNNNKEDDRDDPFLVAYKECTKDTNYNKDLSGGEKQGMNKMMMKKMKMKSMFIFNSCKQTCGVRDDSIVKVSQVPVSISHNKDDQISQIPVLKSLQDRDGILNIWQLPISGSSIQDAKL